MDVYGIVFVCSLNLLYCFETFTQQFPLELGSGNIIICQKTLAKQKEKWEIIFLPYPVFADCKYYGPDGETRRRSN